MAAQSMTQEACGTSGCSNTSCLSGDKAGICPPPGPCVSGNLQGTSNGTRVSARQALSTYGFTFSSDSTCSKDCLSIPLKSGGVFSLSWTRLGGQGAVASTYPDGWMPGGAAAVFSLFPRVNLDASTSNPRIYTDQGPLSFDASSVPQAQLPLSATRGTTYFTTYDQNCGVYFEYFAGTSLLTSDSRYGRVNRRYDTAGNVVQYTYAPNPAGKALLRSLSGDIGGNIVPYFYYADETVDASHGAPITQVSLLDQTTPQNTRTAYFQYVRYTDTGSSNVYSYLSQIINPNGCTALYDPVTPFLDNSDVYQIKRDVDAEGYQTYFNYNASLLTQVAEPEGKITYYEYPSQGETRQIQQGRNKRFTLYSLNSFGDQQTMVTQTTDPLLNTAYYSYDTTLGRMTTQIDPNGNVTYYEYTSTGVDNQFALARKVFAFNNSQTYFGYAIGPNGKPGYDPISTIGPRHLAGSFPVVTYYRYDGSRNRTAIVDPLGNTTLYGPDSAGRTIRQQDPRGNVTYFNYGATSGSLDSQVDAAGNVTYFGYNSFLERTAEVSPRWKETGSFAPFTTYYAYDQSGRRTKNQDAQGNLTYFDWTGRCDPMGTTDALGTQMVVTYNGLRLRTRSTVSDEGGKLLAETKHGYNTYMNRTQTQDGRGNTTYYFYDQIDRPIAMQDPLLNTTYYFYDKVGNRTVLIDARNSAAYYFYDLLSRQTSMQDALANSTYYFYDLANNRTHIIDARNNATYFFYDQLDRPQVKRDMLGNPTYFFYDPVGSQSVVMDARFFSTYFGYDVLNRQTTMRDALANTTYYAYDAKGNRTRVTDARFKTTYFIFDTLDRLSVTMDALGAPTYYFYDAVGNRAKTTDARFNTTYFFYDGLKRTAAQRDALANLSYYFYDVVGNQTVAVDARLNATYFGYDALNRRTAVRDALAGTTYFFYDAVGNRSAIKDARLNVTYFGYDAVNRKTTKQDALSNTTYYFYDAVGNPSKIADARLNTTYYFFDVLNRKAATRDALGNDAYFYYDAVGNQTVAKNARFASTYYGYDALSRRTAMQDALANTTYYAYDAIGNQTSITDARLNTSSITYDALNRESVTTDGIGDSTLYQYDAVGNQIAMLRGSTPGYGLAFYGRSPYGGAPGVATYYFYDALNRRTATRDALGQVTYFFYDATKNRTVIRNSLLHASYFGYDALNRRVRMQDALGATTYYDYDTVGNQTRTFDPDLHATLTQYDAVNRASATLYPDTGAAYYFYDKVSNRIAHLDPLRNATYYGYDELNRAVRVQDSLGKTVYFEYDPVGNLTRFLDSELASSTFTYDLLNRKNNAAYAAAGAVVADGLGAAPYYIYDQVGNVTQMGDLWGLHRMAYDAANRLSQHQYPNQNVVYFRYDTRSNVIARVYPGSAGISGGGYDDLDRQTQIQAPSGATAYFTYDAASNQTKRVLGNNVKQDASYDAAERVQTWRTSNSAGASLTYFDYVRDAKGLVTKAVREANYAVYYTYDVNDRLTAEVWAQVGVSPSEVYGFRYAYDLAGNRTKALVNGTATYYAYDSANQLSKKGTTALFANATYYIYDQVGALTDLVEPGGTTKHAYNAAGLVARTKWKDASFTYFFYDGNLQRYALNQNGTLNYFIWDGMDLLQELKADGTVQEEYTQSKAPMGGIGQLVETNRPGASPQKIYPVMDPRGTITKYVQSDGTTVVASREYDAFGTIIPNSSAGTWPGIFGYQGQTWQEISSANGSQSLLLSPTRLYDPVDGRFQSRDPLRNTRSAIPTGKGLGVYLYGLNSPLQMVDPDGRDWYTVHPPTDERHNPYNYTVAQTLKWVESVRDLWPGRYYYSSWNNRSKQYDIGVPGGPALITPPNTAYELPPEGVFVPYDKLPVVPAPPPGVFPVPIIPIVPIDPLPSPTPPTPPSAITPAGDFVDVAEKHDEKGDNSIGASVTKKVPVPGSTTDQIIVGKARIDVVEKSVFVIGSFTIGDTSKWALDAFTAQDAVQNFNPMAITVKDLNVKILPTYEWAPMDLTFSPEDAVYSQPFDLTVQAAKLKGLNIPTFLKGLGGAVTQGLSVKAEVWGQYQAKPNGPDQQLKIPVIQGDLKIDRAP